MKIRFTPQAYIDLGAIFAFLHAHSPKGAKRVMRRLHENLDLISTQPLNGRQTDEPEVRVWIVARFPYKIFYKIKRQNIIVLHIAHTARRTDSTS